MFNFIGKLAILIIALYLLSFTPFAQEQLSGIKEALLEKVENVMVEIDRVSDEVNKTKQKIDETKQKIEDTKETVTNAAGKIKKTAETIQGTIDKVSKLGKKMNEVTSLDSEEVEKAVQPENKKEIKK